jgi:hypothetical protein
MRHVDTSHLTISEGWRQRAARAEAAVEAAMRDGRALTFTALWRDHRVRDPLIDIIGQKCWYCETNVHSSNPDVDHFRPKNGPATSGAHGGYWWLAYKPDNYRIACKYCNSGGGEHDDGTRRAAKVAQFPLLNESDRATKPADDLKLERPVLLDPADHDDHFLIDFSADGKPQRRIIMPPTALEKAVGICRVEESIKVYRLDRTLLNEDRSGVMEHVTKIAKAMAAIGSRVPAASDDLKEVLQKLINERSPYSGAALSALRACRTLPLIEETFAKEIAADLPRAIPAEIAQSAIIDIANLMDKKMIAPDARLTGSVPAGDVTAVLLSDGRVRFGARLYSNLDSAAKAATGAADTDGWTFWSTTYKGNVVTLGALRDLSWAILVRKLAAAIDGVEGLAKVFGKGVDGGDGLLSGLDLDRSVAAGCLDEFPDRPAGPCLNPPADGQGGEHDRQMGLDGIALAVVNRPGLQV